MEDRIKRLFEENNKLKLKLNELIDILKHWYPVPGDGGSSLAEDLNKIKKL